jgi:AcrR family transcriptional regulator
MGRKAGVDLERVIDTAIVIADEDGLEAATLTAVSSALGIQTPSLYNHVEGLAGLRRAMAIRGAEMLHDDLERAVGEDVGPEALRAVAHAYRAFASSHPGLYQAFLPAPRPEDPVAHAALARPVAVVARVLEGMGVDTADVIPLIRTFRSMLHGFVDLEGRAGFGMPVDIDSSFETAVESMIAVVERATVVKKG